MLTLRKYQADAIDAMRQSFRSGKKRTVLMLPTGSGKCLGKGTKLLMADGSVKPVESVVVGDRLMGPDGNGRTVLSLASGTDRLYRVSSKSGDSYIVNSVHLLSLKFTKCDHAVTLANGEKVDFTDAPVFVEAETFHNSSHTAKHVLKGWRPDAVSFEDEQVYHSIPPYILGLWLGDGTRKQPSICKPAGEVINAWAEYADSIGCRLSKNDSNGTRCPTWRLVKDGNGCSSFLDELRAKGLLDNKHIPREYLIATVEARLDLLAGLLDTDGYVSNGGYDIIQKERRIADGIVFLCRSLGLSARMVPCEKGIKSSGFVGSYYRVSISGDCSAIPCQQKVVGARKQKKRVTVFGIETEYIGVGDYYGFELDGDRQFLLADWQVTHNTFIASEMIRSALARGVQRCLFVCDRIELINQTSERFAADGIDHGVIQAQHPCYAPEKPVQVCSIQTLARRKTEDYALLVIDECFHGDTEVSTPLGDVRIKDIKVGDVVFNAVGQGTVRGVSKKTNKTVTLRLTNGTIVRCTPNHKVFTISGWKEVGKLDGGERVFSKKDVSDMWKHFLANRGVDQNGEAESSCVGKEVGGSTNLLAILFEEIEEPDALKRSCQENASEQEGESWPGGERWEWLCPCSTNGTEEILGRGVGTGVCSKDRGAERKPTPLPLQDRYRESIDDGCYRNRRKFSPFTEEEGRGFEEIGIPDVVRVESVEVDEFGGENTVYNLEVSRHPSYFAGGILVHNCHTLHQAHIKLMEANPESWVVGLTATPFAKGMGKHFDDLVCPVSAGYLIEQGYLSPYVAYGPPTIDVSGVKTVRGDFDPEEIAKRADQPKLVADVVQTWLRRAGGRRTICFATNIAHSKHLVREFQRYGVVAEHLDCYTGNGAEETVTRSEVIGRFRNGQTMVLCNVDIVSKGFDVPLVSCIIQARPTKSLMVHIQQVGRGLRIADGKTECLFLDHAGNHERLGFIDGDLPVFLHGGDKKFKNGGASVEREEPLPKPCPSCDFLKPAGVRKCPACGLVPELIADVETAAGDLEKLKKKARSKYSVEDKQRFLGGLNAWCRGKGWRPGRGGCFGTALRIYKEKFGCDPSSKMDWGYVCEIGEDVKGWLQHCAIRRQKSRPMTGWHEGMAR